MGPLASQRRFRRVSELVVTAVAQGARLRCGSHVAPSGCTGAWYAPTVVTDVTREMRLLREPVDGAILAVIAVDTVEQAIALTNEGEYGRAPRCGRPTATTDRVARELHAGMVWLNDHLPAPPYRADRGEPPRAAASARCSARPA